MASEKIDVLFVASGNHGGMHHGTQAQMQSLKDKGIDVDVYLVEGKGFKGYIKNILPLRRKVKKNDFDIVHAIGGHCGLICTISLFWKKKVISFLGSDIQQAANEKTSFAGHLLRRVIFNSSKNYAQVIVKSKRMLNSLPENVLPKVNVIPNGVDFTLFRPMAMDEARKKLNLHKTKKYVLFLGDKELGNKNYELVERACQLAADAELEILNPFPVDHSLIPFYMNAADLLILTSYSEGSPNIIKEALASNCPIVSTDVGDVAENLLDIEGCFLSTYNAADVADKIKAILKLNKRTNAREKIPQLDKALIAERIISVYRAAIKQK
jgi:teichuronic acid biosynthesis glycosyltransferase TuaC